MGGSSLASLWNWEFHPTSRASRTSSPKLGRVRGRAGRRGEESKPSTAMPWAIPDPAPHEKNKRHLPLLSKLCAVQERRQGNEMCPGFHFCCEEKQEEWQHHAEAEKLSLGTLHNSGLSLADVSSSSFSCTVTPGMEGKRQPKRQVSSQRLHMTD